MIERFYLKDYLSFDEVELNLNTGLVVFTGPSGSGKSILMNSILTSFGGASCDASLCESCVTWEISEDNSSIQTDDINVFKHLRKEKSRYFLNNQSLSKKAIHTIASKHLRYLSLKDYSDFENENLLSILDKSIEKKHKGIQSLKKEYKQSFWKYQSVLCELKKLQEKEKKIIELKEFAIFEIEKIDSVNPKTDEDKELQRIKKELSKKEKVLQNIAQANEIFNFEYHVSKALGTLDVDSSFFDDAMNELRALFDGVQEHFGALDEVDIEEVLNRIEKLSDLKRRYGSIEEALAYKEQKKEELTKYENIEITKEDLELQNQELGSKVKKLSEKISALRKEELSFFEENLNKYLRDLYLRDAHITIVDSPYTMLGKDNLNIKLNNTDLSKVSTGEFNRLRLAILALKSEFMSKNGGVLMLDEIDANLSGEESMSVARVLRKLSQHFQIFVISHQPQLTSMGDQHFLIYKEGEISKTKELGFDEKIDEIARIISGKGISEEARKFAKELLEANKCVS